MHKWSLRLQCSVSTQIHPRWHWVKCGINMDTFKPCEVIRNRLVLMEWLGACEAAPINTALNTPVHILHQMLCSIPTKKSFSAIDILDSLLFLIPVVLGDCTSVFTNLFSVIWTAFHLSSTIFTKNNLFVIVVYSPAGMHCKQCGSAGDLTTVTAKNYKN